MKDCLLKAIAEVVNRANLAIVLLLLSVGIMGQVVVTNPSDLQPVGSNLNLTPPIILSPCDTPNYYPCALAANTVCVDDGNSQYHCECIENYVKDDNGVCRSLCYGVTCSDLNAVCNENIVEGKAICLDEMGNDASKGGVLLCDDLNLTGTCYLSTEKTTVTHLGFYPKSMKALNGWEVYLPFSTMDGEIRELNAFYSNDNIVNIDNSNYFLTTDDGIDWYRERFIIQPDTYSYFTQFYGTEKIYVEILAQGIREVFKDIGSANVLGYNIRKVTTNNGIYVVTSPGLMDITTFDGLDNSLVRADTIKILKTGETDISEGLYVCSVNNCKGFKYHAYWYNSTHSSNNWDNTTNSEIMTNANEIYLHNGWEALACPEVSSELKDCKKINTEHIYNNWSEIMGTNEIPQFLIVQPASKEKLEELSGGKYSILYSDPNYRGNSIAYWKLNERYPNPIKQVSSAYSKGINTYLNNSKIETIDDFYIKNINPSDNYLHTTDSTPWKFEKIVIKDELTDERFFWNNVILENSNNEIVTDGVLFKVRECFHYLTGRINENYDLTCKGTSKTFKNLSESDINLFKVKKNWETYICRDYKREDCKYFSFKTENQSDDLKSFLSGETIKYLLIQPTISLTFIDKDTDDVLIIWEYTHQKINQFYGHKEYNEYNDIDALSGYVVLYKNSSFQDCEIIDYDTFSNCDQKEIVYFTPESKVEIGVDTLIKSNEIKAIRVVGDIDVGYRLYNDTNLYSLNPKYSNTINNLYYLIFGKGKATVVASAAYDSPGRYMVATFGVKSKEDSSSIIYYKNSDYPYDGTLINESLSQNKEIDNGDLLLLDGHSSWKNGTVSISAIPDKKYPKYFKSYTETLELGRAFGDYETEWLLMTGCSSIGNDDSSRPAVMNSYKQMFINGLHGVGGFRGTSCWPGILSLNKYIDEVDDMWSRIRERKPISTSWMSSLVMFGTGHFFGLGCARYPGYIAPGACNSSYMKDKYHGYGELLPDPDRKLIDNEGLCYISFDDDYGPSTFFKHKSYDDFDVLIGDDLEQNNLNQIIANNIISYNNNNTDNTNIYSKTVSFKKEVNDYLTVNGGEIVSVLTDDLIKELQFSVENVYESLFADVLKGYSYELDALSSVPLIGYHYKEDNSNDYSVINEVLFNFSLSYKGYPFIEENNIMIGINPKTKEITTIKSKLLALKPISKFDNEEIEYDFSLLKETDEFSYTKSYIITEDKSYHVAILSFNKLTAEVDIVKIY